MGLIQIAIIFLEIKYCMKFKVYAKGEMQNARYRILGWRKKWSKVQRKSVHPERPSFSEFCFKLASLNTPHTPLAELHYSHLLKGLLYPYYCLVKSTFQVLTFFIFPIPSCLEVSDKKVHRSSSNSIYTKLSSSFLNFAYLSAVSMFFILLLSTQTVYIEKFSELSLISFLQTINDQALPMTPFLSDLFSPGYPLSLPLSRPSPAHVSSKTFQCSLSSCPLCHQYYHSKI